MSNNPVTDLLSAQDMAPYLDEFEAAVDSIVFAQASSNEPDPRLSELAQTIDDRQARSIVDILRERLKPPPDQEHDPYTEVRIGTVWFNVPPSAIRVRDIRFNDDVPGLRSTSNSLIKTGRGRIKVDMMIDFPDEASINDQLRPLIAQFRTTPFLPIESQYVFNSIMAYAAQVDPKYLDDMRLKLDRVWTDYNKVKDEMVQAVVGNPSLMALAFERRNYQGGIGSEIMDAIIAEYRGMYPDELLKVVSDLVQDIPSDLAGVEWTDKGARLNAGEGSQFQRNLRALTKIEELALAANELLDEIRAMYADLAKLGIPEASRRPIVHVVLHTLEAQTSPGESDGVTVRLSMMFFSYGAYVTEITYKNPEGYPTVDIGECPYFDAYVRRRFLQGSSSALADQEKAPRGLRYLGRYSPKGGQTWVFKYPTPQFEPVSDDDTSREDLVPPIRADHIGGGRSYNLAAQGNKNASRKWRAGEETLNIQPDSDIIIPKQVVITLQNRIALQPIQASMYGTAQHLGTINARISVAFDVAGNDKLQHDLGVAQIMRMKLQSERVAMIGGPKVRRNSRIAVRNDIMALFGVKYVQLDNTTVRTNPGEIWSSSVQVDFTEYTVSQEKREQLRLQKSDYRGSLLRGSLEFGIAITNKYLRGDSSGKRGDVAVNSDAGQYCRAVLYGSDKKGDTGIMSERLLTHVIANRPDIVRLLVKHIQDEAASKKPDGTESSETSGSGEGRRTLLEKLQAGQTSGWRSPEQAWAYSRDRSRSSPLASYWDEQSAQETGKGSPVNPQQMKKRAQEECERLAKEMLEFWRRSKRSTNKNSRSRVDQIVADVTGGTVPTVIRDSKNIIDIQDTPQSFLNDIIEALYSNYDFSDELGWAQAFGDYCLDNFEEVQQYYKSKLEAIRGNSNYPDMDLPTYSDMFLGSKEAISEALGSQVDDMEVKLLRVFTYKYMGAKTKKVLRRFIPTWRDLGKRAPLDQDPYSLAKKFTDFVDPDFFYFHNRMSMHFDSFAEEVEDEAENLYTPSQNVVKADPAARIKDQQERANAKRIQGARTKSEELGNRFIESQDDVTMNLDAVPDPDGKPASWFYRNGQWYPTRPKVGFGTQDYHRYTSGDPKIQQQLDKFVHDDPGHMASLFRETVQSQRDNTDRMVRAFPTFRFMFIEVDNEEWGYWDDFYAYNAIVDIQMSEHKFEPSLLQIRIINTTGNLDEARSRMEDPDRTQEDASWIGPDGKFKDPRKPIGSSEIEANTGEPRQLSKFFLQTGTNVKLMMGYGSGEEDLETVFLGQVVQVNPGDVITLICQSYKNELTVPLNTYKSGYDSDPWDVIDWVMEESPTEHFGKWSPYETGLAAGRNRAGEKWNTDSTERLGWHGYRLGPPGQSEARQQQTSTYGSPITGGMNLAGNVSGLTPVRDTDTVFQTFGGGKVASNVINTVVNELAGLGGLPNYIASLSSTRKMSNVYLPRHSAWRELFSTSREFLIPDRSGLEVLHELSRHLPGYIAEVRPYDHRATLFFGKPEQRYFYTSLKQGEERLWQKFKDRQTKEAKAAEEAFIRVMRAFEQHPLGTAFKAGLRARHSTGKNLAKGISQTVGSLPGKAIGFMTFGILGKDYEKAGERIGRNIFYGYTESPDVVTQVRRVEKYLGRTNILACAVHFLNLYASRYGAGKAGADALIGASLTIATFGAAGTKTLRKGVRGLFTEEQLAGEQVGTLFASLNGWRDKLDKISVRNDGTAETNNRIRYQTFEMSTDVKLFNTMRDSNAGVVDATGRQIDRERYEKAVEAIIDYIPDWKDFITLLDTYIQLKIAEGDTDLLKEAYKTGRIIERFEHNPRTKKFRQHHYVDSTKHIIRNGIVATKEQMANTVVIKYPDDVDYNEGGGKYYMAQDVDWNTFELPVDMNLKISEKKVRLVTEINADDYERAKLAGFSNLAEALRPMYRGELILRGDEKIRPFDTVWVNDLYENMFGPVEVERVITHFSAETGYTTTIVPQLVTIPQSRSSWIDNLACGQVNAVKSVLGIPGAIDSALDAVGFSTGGKVALAAGLETGLAFPPTTLFTGTVIAGGLIGGGLYQSFALKEQTGAGIWGNLTGRGRYGSLRNPVDIIPLVRNGIPWTAGLRGWGDDNWKLRLFKRWANVKRGASLAWGATKPTYDKVNDWLGF